jgi:regulatory protein
VERIHAEEDGCVETASAAAVDPAREVERAIALAYRSLSRRDRTEAELRTALERRGLGADAIDVAVAEVAAAGYLDDAGYARRFAEDRRSLDGWGPERIARDLERRGVAGELIEAAIGDGGAGAEELDRALGVLAERLPAPPQTDRERQRAWSMLVRRGYPAELAYEAVREHARATSHVAASPTGEEVARSRPQD